ncbi:MAG: hypothetical protein ACHP8A_02670 [Terriglobales bacterium]
MPVDIRIARNLPQFTIHIPIAKTTTERMQAELFNIPAHRDLKA